MSWPPDDAGIATETWSLDELHVGDLVFGQRDSGPLAWLCDHAGEPWRHVASLVEGNSGLEMVELLGDRFRLGSVDRFFDADRYVRWGAVRLDLDPDCIAAANDWMISQLGGESEAPQVYAWDDLILAGLISASHRGLFAQHPQRVRSAIESAGVAAKDALTYRDQDSLTCSAFIQLAYEAAGGGCAIQHPRWRGDAAVWPPRSLDLDELLSLTADELTEYDGWSVIDAYAESLGVERGTSTTRIRPGQPTELLRVLAGAVRGFRHPENAPAELTVDSRWVTPGDLWRSPSVYRRAVVAL